jgi:DNA-binding NarL/FixJ family response regulator
MSQRRLVVVIVDDHELFGQGLALLLGHRWGEEFEVAGRTTAVEEAGPLAVRTKADLAVVDLTMPPLGGVTAIRAIRKLSPRTRILALSGTYDLVLAQEALRSGADGFLPKTAQPDELVAPLRTIASGLRVVDGAVLDDLLHTTRKPSAALLDQLDAQDLELWVLLARGLETADIAKRMLVSERTAKRMMASLLHKIGAGNRIAAAGLAGRFGLLDDRQDDAASDV